jgi:hypothetical protein
MKGTLKEALRLLEDASTRDLVRLTGRDLKRLAKVCVRWARLAETELRRRVQQ